jgi:hypothetical protein
MMLINMEPFMNISIEDCKRVVKPLEKIKAFSEGRGLLYEGEQRS